MTRPPRVHQFVATLGERDAVSNHTLALHRILRDRLGCDAEIFAVSVNAKHEAGVHLWFDHDDLPAADLVVYQACTGSPVADYLGDSAHERSVPLVIDYHNITPPELFGDWDPATAAVLAHGRRQMARLMPRSRLVLADSAYSKAEAEAWQAPKVVVAPVLFDMATMTPPKSVMRGDQPPSRALSAQTPGGSSGGNGSPVSSAEGAGAVWLFVGRLAPHKAQHHLLAALAVYRDRFDPHATLVLAGAGSLPSYEHALRSHASELGLADAVTFAGSVSSSELAAIYESADVFVCLSDHEGFCVPLLEALHFGVPVVAFDAAAVGETVGDAGLVIGNKSPVSVAAAVSKLLDQARRVEVPQERAAARLARFDMATTTKVYVKAFEALLADCGGR